MTVNRPTDIGSFRFLPTPDVTTEAADDDNPINPLRQIGSVAWRYRYLIVAWTLLCVVVAAVVARSTPRTYSAAASILLDPRRPPSTGREAAAAPVLDLNRADTELQVIRSERLLRRVFDGLDLARSDEFAPRRRLPALPSWGGPAAPVPDEADLRQRLAFAEFTRRVSVRRIGQSYVVEVAYTAYDPILAAKVANAVATAYLLQSVTHKLESARAGSEWVQARADMLAAQVAATTSSLREGRAPSGPMPDADGRMVGEALVPLGPSAPRPTLIVALGAVAGIGTSLLLVVLVGLFDRRLQNAGQVAAQTGLPCLAAVPQARSVSWFRPMLKQQKDNLVQTQPEGAFAKAVVNLRAAIRLAMPPLGARSYEVIAVVAWAPGTGSSFLAMNLARLSQRIGRRVTVIEADVEDARRSVVSARSGDLGSLVGLLSHRVAEGQVRFQDLGGVSRLPAWLPEDGGAIVDLDSPPTMRLLDDCRSRGDVILDLPPLRDTAAAAALARRADAVVIVASASHTTIDEVQAAARLLGQAGANVIGVVLNRIR
jgi:Mrp family chromosome partitioning ATPase/capsular polysaccharide biosynthesis protein